MEFARRGRGEDVDDDVDDDGRRFLYPPPHGGAILVIRDALLSQLQTDRLRQEIIVAELAKIEHAMALCGGSCDSIVAGDVERTKVVASSFSEMFVPQRRWPVSLEHYADLDDLHDLKKGGRQGGGELRSVQPAREGHVGDCSRPCCNGEERAPFDGQKLQESNENIQLKETTSSVKWELTEITIPVKKPKPPQKWICCTICQVRTPSEHHLQEHYAGKKHRSNVATLESRNKAISQKAETTEELSFCADQKTSPIKLSCSTCQANGSSESDLKEHLNGSAHQQNIEAQGNQGGGMAKNVDMQEAKCDKSNVPQHAEKPPPVWSCSICQAHCSHESDLGIHILENIQALMDEISNMARKFRSQEPKSPPNIVSQHAKQTSRSDCSICQANCDNQSDSENHLGGKIHQLNVQPLHKEAKQMKNIEPEIANDQQPSSEWDSNICQAAECNFEPQFESKRRRRRKKVEVLQGEGKDAKSSGLKPYDKLSSDGSDSKCASSEEGKQTIINFCEVCHLQFNCENMLVDHYRGEEHLEKQKLLNFCEVCSLQCNSIKMLVHHCTGKKHLKKLNANK